MAKLVDYNKKRDFKQTPEPEGKLGKKNEFRYCVQMHDATNLHYDLRIEYEGVLLSWAVPKGPSADPSKKRLAIQTEDHPISYLTFEGTIPKGNYGGGSMILWDLGHFSQPADKKGQKLEKMLDEQYKAGKIHLSFTGKKLKGEYSLIRTNKSKGQWLFFKVKDEHVSKKAFSEKSVLSGRKVTEVKEKDNALGKIMKEGKSQKFPKDFKPMLAKLSKEVFNDESWIFEVKYDGYRCLIFKEDDKVRILSRNGLNMNSKFQELVEAASVLPANCVLDGEIIVADKTGGGSFSKLQQFIKKSKKQSLRLVLFDLIYLEGRDFSDLPLIERKQALEKVMESIDSKLIKYSSHIEKKGKEYLKASKKLGLEGIMGKKKKSLYLKKKRSSDWLKFKNVNEDDFIVVGLTPSPSSREFGSLILARPDKKGKFEFAGKVGTGFSKKSMKSIFNQLKKKKTKKGLVDAEEEVLFYTEPYYYAQVNYTEVTEEGKLRHPSFVTLREDKFYAEEAAKIAKPELSAKDEKEKIETPKGVKLSNTDKVFFPKENITKGDVISYYQQMVDHILPQLKNRPMTLKRTPNGIKDEGFYQKDVKDDLPKYLHTKSIASKSSEKDNITYAFCNNHKSLIFLANYGCVEMHCWNSREDKLNHPDHIIFDIDPPSKDFGKAKEATLILIKLLDELKINYGIKTSGSSGLHLYVPIQRKYTHTQVRDIAHIIAKIWLKKMGKKGSLERSPAKRKTQVYLDYLQNAKGKTMACPYSLRVKPGVPVSMPLSLDELEKIQSADEMNIATVPELMKKRKNPWEGLYDNRMKLEKIIESVEALGMGEVL